MRSGQNDQTIELKEQAREPVAQLCANLYLNRDGGPAVLAITSAESGEGRSSLAIALGVQVSETLGESTLVIEANFRNSGMSRLLCLSKDSEGFADLLSGKAKQDEVIHSLGGGLSVITAGQNSSEEFSLLMDRTQVETVLKNLSSKYKYIIMEVPPINKYPEALVLSKISDSAILTIRAGVTGRESVSLAVKRLEVLGEKFAGLVLNQKQYPLPAWLYKRL